MNRRNLLTASAGVPDHISSAVVMVVPGRAREVEAELLHLPGVEIHAGEESRLVITLEGESSGALGEMLARIAGLRGVIAANMVFEHVGGSEETD